MAPKLRFYVDFNEDLRYVFFRITSLDPAGFGKRLKDKNYDPEFVQKFSNTVDNKEKLEILEGYLKDHYLKHESEMVSVCQKYKDIWQDKQEIFFSTITTLMDSFEWNYPEYTFLVSSFFSKASWGTSNRLGVWWVRDPERYWHLNGYELTLTHYFEVVDKIYPSRPVSDWHLWALAEITAYFLTYKDKHLTEKLWPQIQEPGRFSYPQLIKPINDLWKVYREVSSFKEFVGKGVEYIQIFTLEELTRPKV